jgi:hypothetical protein
MRAHALRQHRHVKLWVEGCANIEDVQCYSPMTAIGMSLVRRNV